MIRDVDLVSCVINFAKLRLNSKQRVLILEIYSWDKGISELIRWLAGELSCSEGCLWGNLRELRKIGLVSDGVLSEIGKLIYLELVKGGNC